MYNNYNTSYILLMVIIVIVNIKQRLNIIYKTIINKIIDDIFYLSITYFFTLYNY